MLPEARGYGLALHLAHQHLGQLPRELHDALSANARTKVYFTVSPEDARALERHVHPQLSAYDLSHLGSHQAAVRLVADGSELPACTIRTRPATPVIPGRAELARASARARFGRTSAQRHQEAQAREFGGGKDARGLARRTSPPPRPGLEGAAAMEVGPHTPHRPSFLEKPMDASVHRQIRRPGWPGCHICRHLWRHICRHLMRWRPPLRRSCRSVPLAAGPAAPRLASLFRLPAPLLRSAAGLPAGDPGLPADRPAGARPRTAHHCWWWHR